ncbi:hypothetical protein [Chryseobacterium sp. BIGb0232]|uniref:hypothetical protein n=1 Tax=Chryseobacterium sp. BIGb0232 TaxID=2940598 RepID=UPI000F4A960E|nr:hypothetical protein [Chryseobacterium sp. BIGb0232]MCS4301381.1 hypothetical protein [Chryseobacterium sp. BIGb0232]ROS19761.1 hypothetical protein EDF65_0454 [Chryseobacterium nakagawai]
MAKKTIAALKEYFKAGKRPTEAQFGDVMDSFASLEDKELFPKNYIKKSLDIKFPHNVSDQAVDILLGNRGMAGRLEIEIVGTYMYWNSAGNIKKMFQLGFNPDNDIWHKLTSRIVEAGELITDHIYIGDIVWDANINQYKITIYHTHHSGNIYDVRLTYYCPFDTQDFSDVKISDIYTNPLSGQRKHFVHYNENVGIKTRNPIAPLDVQGKILFDPESPVIGGAAIKGYETMWARGYHFISSDGTQNIGGFAAVGEQNRIYKYYIGKYEDQIVSFNPENRQSSFGGNINVNGEVKSTSQRVFEYSPTIYLDRSVDFGGYTQGIQTRLSDGTNNWFFGNGGPEAFIISSGTYDGGRQLVISRNGNAAFQGKVEAKEFLVSATPTADHVFASDYNLRGIHDLEKFITEKSHLPEIPSAKEMTDNGLSLGDFQIKLLQKIEELTLYAISQNKEIENLKAIIKK